MLIPGEPKNTCSFYFVYSNGLETARRIGNGRWRRGNGFRPLKREMALCRHVSGNIVVLNYAHAIGFGEYMAALYNRLMKMLISVDYTF